MSDLNSLETRAEEAEALLTRAFDLVANLIDLLPDDIKNDEEEPLALIAAQLFKDGEHHFDTVLIYKALLELVK